MKTVFAATLLAFTACALADPPADIMNIVREADVKFMPSKTTPGLSQAILLGDPNVPGQPYIVRNRFSPGAFSAPHFHPEARYILVIKGTWWVGAGPVQDKSQS